MSTHNICFSLEKRKIIWNDSPPPTVGMSARAGNPRKTLVPKQTGQYQQNNVSGVRSAMHAASQLHVPGRGPTDVDDAPAPACYSKI